MGAWGESAGRVWVGEWVGQRSSVALPKLHVRSVQEWVGSGRPTLSTACTIHVYVHIPMCTYTCVHTHSLTTLTHTHSPSHPALPVPALPIPSHTHSSTRTATDVTELGVSSLSIADRWDNYLVAAAELKDPTISKANETFHKCLGKVHSTLPNTGPPSNFLSPQNLLFRPSYRPSPNFKSLHLFVGTAALLTRSRHSPLPSTHHFRNP